MGYLLPNSRVVADAETYNDVVQEVSFHVKLLLVVGGDVSMFHGKQGIEG